MQLTGLLDVLRGNAAYRELLARLQTDATSESFSVLRAARPFVLAALAQDWRGAVIYVTARVDQAYNVAEQLPVWLGERRVLRFAEPAPLFYERAPWGESAIRSRIETLAALMPPGDVQVDPQPPVIVTSARALMKRTLPVNQFRKASMLLKVRERHALDETRFP